MERTLKEKQGAVGEQYFSVADEVMSLGIICCLEHGAESRRHTTCRSSQAHRSEMQGLRGHPDAVFSRNPQGWLEGQGSHFRCGEQGCSSFKQPGDLSIFRGWGSMLRDSDSVCVCSKYVCFLVEKEAVILTSSPDGSDVGGQWTRLRDFTSRTYRMLQRALPYSCCIGTSSSLVIKTLLFLHWKKKKKKEPVKF